MSQNTDYFEFKPDQHQVNVDCRELINNDDLQLPYCCGSRDFNFNIKVPCPVAVKADTNFGQNIIDDTNNLLYDSAFIIFLLAGFVVARLLR